MTAPHTGGPNGSAAAFTLRMRLGGLDREGAILDALRAFRTAGSVEGASRVLGCGYNTLRRWIARDQDLKEGIERERGNR